MNVLIQSLGLLLLCLPLSAKEYFVSLQGADSNEGQIQSPFRTFETASHYAMPGDTVTIREGRYEPNKPFSPSRSGEKNREILYRAMPEEKVIIDGNSILYLNDSIPFSGTTSGIIQIEGVSHICFQNIQVSNSRAAGIIVRGPQTKQIELAGCRVDRTYNSGIGLWYADSVKVTNCEITRANDIDYRNQEVPKPGEAPHEALSICGTRYFEVAYNKVHNCYKEGIDCKEVSRHGIIHHNLVFDMPRQAYYVDAWFGLLEDVELYANTAYNCGWGFAISVEGKDSEIRNIRFHHNILYNMKGAGILFGAWGENRLRSNIHIYNNTIYHTGSPDWFSGGVGSIDILSPNFKDVYIYRNICDKGWDYELGFSLPVTTIQSYLKEHNFIVAENLFECKKNRPSRAGQFGLIVSEYWPKENKQGAPLYKNEREYDLTPERLPIVKEEGIQWKYTPSPWYGALQPLHTY